MSIKHSHPADAWGRPPRRKDRDDVGALARYWREEEGYTRAWNPIVRSAIDALPQGQADRTLDRLRTALK